MQKMQLVPPKEFMLGLTQNVTFSSINIEDLISSLE